MFEHITSENYEPQLQQKVSAMSSLFADFAIDNFDIYRSVPTHYRQRAELRVWHDGDDLYYIMFDKETKQKFKVETLPLASQLINQAMQQLLLLIKDNELLRRKLFQVDFLTSLKGELLISLLYHKPLSDEWQQQALQLKQQLNQLAPCHLIGRARKQKLILDQDYIYETLTVDGKQLHYQQIENSFTQPNAVVNQHMLSWARKVSQPLHGDLIELYCGNGNFSLALSDCFDRVLGTEISKSSVKSAQHNIALNNIDNVKIVRMASEDFSLAMQGEQKFRRLTDIDLTDYSFDTVLVDPPRAGLDPDTIALVQKFKHIIYISCNPNTLKDNLTELTKSHNLEQFALFDQFPFTEHIESGVLLSRKD